MYVQVCTCARVMRVCESVHERLRSAMCYLFFTTRRETSVYHQQFPQQHSVALLLRHLQGVSSRPESSGAQSRQDRLRGHLLQGHLRAPGAQKQSEVLRRLPSEAGNKKQRTPLEPGSCLDRETQIHFHACVQHPNTIQNTCETRAHECCAHGRVFLISPTARARRPPSPRKNAEKFGDVPPAHGTRLAHRGACRAAHEMLARDEEHVYLAVEANLAIHR